MGPFSGILQELQQLQERLKLAGESLWRTKFLLQRAYRAGHGEADFLPRRLTALQNETQSQFENLLAELRYITSKNLQPPLFVFNSSAEVELFIKIKQIISYLQNAYMDQHLRKSVSHLYAILPFSR